MYFHSFFCCCLTFPEELLNNFAQQIGAWRFCLYFLSSTRNDYVMMYSLTVFEVSCQILLRYSGEYFVVTLPCPRPWTSLWMCSTRAPSRVRRCQGSPSLTPKGETGWGWEASCGDIYFSLSCYYLKEMMKSSLGGGLLSIIPSSQPQKPSLCQSSSSAYFFKKM